MAFLGFVPLLLAIAAPVLASPLVSSGGKVIRWNRSVASPNINYWIDPGLPANIQTNAINAFVIWQAVPTAYVTLSSVGAEATNQINVKLYGSISTGGIPAQASYSYDSAGNMTVCEVQVSQNVNSSGYSANYLASAMIHEVGHCLGLGHSIVSQSVMSYLGNNPLWLSPDDEFAITALYPNDDSLVYPLGCATIKGEDGPGNGRRAASWLVMLGAMLAAWWVAQKLPRLRALG